MKENNLNKIKYRKMFDKNLNNPMQNILTLASCNSFGYDWNDYMKTVDEVDNFIRNWTNENAKYDGHKLVAWPTNEEILLVVIEHFKDSEIHQCVINDIL